MLGTWNNMNYVLAWLHKYESYKKINKKMERGFLYKQYAIHKIHPVPWK